MLKVKEPCGHRVLVKLRPPEELSKGTIYIPKDIQDRHHKGVDAAYVVKVGVNAFKGFDDGQAWCKEGDLVGLRQYSGHNYELGGELLTIINDEDVLCILEEVSDE